MSSNKYNSIRETLAGVMLPPVLLSTYATPPAAFSIPAADMPAIAVVQPSGNPYFAINDIPNVQLSGVFSPLADGLTPNTSHVRWVLKLLALNNVNATVGTVKTFIFPETNFNAYTECDFFAATVAAIQANLPGYIALGATKMLFTAEAAEAWPLAAYSMAPAWAAAQISFTPKIVVEHTFPMTA